MLFNHECFFKAFKMSPTRFEEFLPWIAPVMCKPLKVRDVTGPSVTSSTFKRQGSKEQYFGSDKQTFY